MINTLRFIVFNMLAWCAVVPWAIGVLLAWPISANYSYAVARSWSQVVGWLVKNICGLKCRVEGIENFPEEPCVVFLKHSSAFETYMMLTLFPRSCWVLKRELLWVPFFGWTLIPLKAIAIDRAKRSAAVTQVIEQGKERLAEGINVSIFPEGTRMAPGTTKRYGKSGTLLAQAANCKIVPIAHNSGYYWPRRAREIVPGEVRFIVGEPVDPQGKDAGLVNQEIQTWVETEIASIVESSQPKDDRA